MLWLAAILAIMGLAQGGAAQNKALWEACGAEHPSLGYEGGVNAGKGNLDAVKAALKSGADIDAKEEAALGATCMMTAGANNYTDVVLYLISEGANIDLTGNTKRTTLMWATRWGHHDIVRILLAAGANTKTQDTSNMDAEKIANAKGMTHIGKYSCACAQFGSFSIVHCVLCACTTARRRENFARKHRSKSPQVVQAACS